VTERSGERSVASAEQPVNPNPLDR
jgi:hypothetical protein